MKKLLVAGKDAYLRVILKDILKRNGYSVISEAANGGRVLELYKKYKPDAVIINTFLEDMTGDVAVQKIISFDPHAVIVMVSYEEDKNIIMNSIRMGAKDFILCPIQADMVLAAIEKKLS